MMSIGALFKRAFRSERWHSLVAAVEEEMLYGPEVTANKHTLDFDYLGHGDLIKVDGKWCGIRHILHKSTVVLLNGRAVSKTELPETLHYRHKREGSLMTITLMLTFSAVALAGVGVLATVVSVIVALLK